MAESATIESRQGSHLNVARPERVVSALAGGALTLYGLAHGKVSGWATALLGSALLYRGTSGHCPAYEALGVNTAEGEETLSAVRMSRSVSVNRPRGELYAFWRQLENLPQFMRHLESVRAIDDRRSQWSARLPKGLGTIEWEAEIVDDDPDRRIAWRSLPEAQVTNRGEVRFDDLPGGLKGTEVHVEIEYFPPAGALGKTAAKLLNPVFSQMVREDVRRFKHLMETGEIPTTEGQPRGH